MIAADGGIKVKRQMNIVDSIFKDFAESTLYHHRYETSLCEIINCENVEVQQYWNDCVCVECNLSC